jgi:hypothetical protein
MKQLFIFPTWILIKLLNPILPKNHPLKKKITLKDWTEHTTQLNIAFSILFWINSISLFYFLMHYTI